MFSPQPSSLSVFPPIQWCPWRGLLLVTKDSKAGLATFVSSVSFSSLSIADAQVWVIDKVDRKLKRGGRRKMCIEGDEEEYGEEERAAEKNEDEDEREEVEKKKK